MDQDKIMLDALGFREYEDLFSDIPKEIRKRDFSLDKHIAEHELLTEAHRLSKTNDFSDFHNFLGCGSYDRVIPASVDSLVTRAEFITAYTPYQAEISQGMLQSLFEYQSLSSDLMGMDATNSSMYDGPTSLGEAVRMAYRVNQRSVILIPENMYANKRSILENYVSGLDVRFVEYAMDQETGKIDLADLQSKIGPEVSAVIVENPNSYGIIDDNVLKVKELLKDQLLIAYVDPISLGVLTPPGEYGADIAVAEGQQLGIHQNYGGPYLGIFSFRKELVRKSPGRIIGETTDAVGRRSFVMTLQTREQHIRRDKATSNICTNQALMGITALCYLSVVGPDGLKKVALATMKHSSDLRSAIRKTARVDSNIFTGQSFSDVPVRIALKPEELDRLLKDGRIFGGISLAKLIRNKRGNLDNAYFFSVTEKTTGSMIQSLASVLGGA